MKRYLKLTLKLAVSGGALWWVFSKIDLPQTKNLLLSIQWGWFSLAFLFFNLSKVVSAFRLNNFFRDIGFKLSESVNMRLNYIGMFYNLFLPGGIGGDGYKVYLLNKRYGQPVKTLVKAVLLDRISGLVALVLLAFGLLAFISFDGFVKLPHQGWLALACMVVSVFGYYLAVHTFFSAFRQNFLLTSLQSIGVQSLQVICAFFLLLSLRVDGLYLEYQFLFLVSSVVAVFPFTVGGVGAREATFLLGHQYLGIEKNTAVAFSLLFFLATVVSSLAGMFLKSGLADEQAVATQSSASRASSISESSS